MNARTFGTIAAISVYKKMTFDKITGFLRFGHEEYPNIHMEEVNSESVMALA